MAGGSTHVIATAFAANMGIAVAKFVAAVMTGSSAMLTKGIHCVVDSIIDVLTVHHAPEPIVAIIDADFDDRISAGDVERIARDIEAKVAADFPVVSRLYVRLVSG